MERYVLQNHGSLGDVTLRIVYGRGLRMKKIVVSVFCIVFVLSLTGVAFAADSKEPKKDPPKKDAPAKVIETPKKEEPKKEEAKKEEKKPEAKKEAPAAAPAPAASDKEQSRKVTIAIRKLSDKLAESMKYLPEGKYGVMAVMNFQETGKLTKEKELGALVSMELATYLHKDHRVEMVEREKLDKGMGEISLRQSGLIDENTASKIGRMVQAQALVVGSVSEAGADFLVNARMVGVENGMVLVSENTKIPVAGMVALSSEAVVLRSKGGATYRSLILPGWGQHYNLQPVKGVVYSSVTALLFGSAIWFHFQGLAKVDEYKKETNPAATDKLKKYAEERWELRNIAIYCGAGFWAWNVLDAYIFGMDAGKALAGEPTGRPQLAATPDGAMLQYGFSF
jgi:TolB-like protein